MYCDVLLSRCLGWGRPANTGGPLLSAVVLVLVRVRHQHGERALRAVAAHAPYVRVVAAAGGHHSRAVDVDSRAPLLVFPCARWRYRQRQLSSPPQQAVALYFARAAAALPRSICSRYTRAMHCTRGCQHAHWKVYWPTCTPRSTPSLPLHPPHLHDLFVCLFVCVFVCFTVF